MEDLEWLSILLQLIIALSTVVAATVAVRGLSLWREQLSGRVRFDIARRLLKATYELRDAFRRVRNSAMWGHEMERPNEDEVSKMSFEEIEFHRIATAYERRWAKVSEAHGNLASDLLEMEVLFGREATEVFNDIFEIENKLFRALRDHLTLQNPKTREGMKEAINKRRLPNEIDEIIFDVPENEDWVDNSLMRAIEKVENHLKREIITRH